MPLFVRAGSIIPYGPSVEYAMEKSDPIELRVYRGDDGVFTLYEDEGDNYVEGFKGLKLIGYGNFVSFECGCAGDKLKVIPEAVKLLKGQWAMA